MLKTITRLYKQTGNEEIVTKALVKGWISEAEAEEILNS